MSGARRRRRNRSASNSSASSSGSSTSDSSASSCSSSGLEELRLFWCLCGGRGPFPFWIRTSQSTVPCRRCKRECHESQDPTPTPTSTSTSTSTTQVSTTTLQPPRDVSTSTTTSASHQVPSRSSPKIDQLSDGARRDRRGKRRGGGSGGGGLTPEALEKHDRRNNDREIRQFGCVCSVAKAKVVWFRWVDTRKPVSRCRCCGIRYDAIPKEEQFGWAEFKCSCGHEWTSDCSKVYVAQPCRMPYCGRTVQPTMQAGRPLGTKGPRKSQATHSCEKCPTGECRRFFYPSKVHNSTGSTISSADTTRIVVYKFECAHCGDQIDECTHEFENDEVFARALRALQSMYSRSRDR